MNKLEFEVKNTRNMVDELYEYLANNPGFTGTIELFGSLKCKTIDRYYIIGYCKDGKFHKEDGYAILMNYKDHQYVEYYLEGKWISSDSWNYFDHICE